MKLFANDYAYQPTSVSFRTADEKMQHVYDRCIELCNQNVKMFGCRKVIQEGAKYQGVWLETQPMGGEMYAKRDMEAALNNQLIFMEFQRRDGKMPGMIRYSLPWMGTTVHYDWMQGDFFTIPALKMYYHIGKDREYLEMLYTALKDFDNYLWSCRDSDGDGCLETWCVWDTGDDNNTRLLTQRIHAKRDGSWNGNIAPDNESGLPLESAEYMAYSYAHCATLVKICEILENGEADLWRERAQKVQKRFIEYLWDDERKFAFDRDKYNEKIDSISMENIKCMYQGIFTQEMADDFIREHMMNPEEFFTFMPLPNFAVNDPLFYLSKEVNNLGDKLPLVEQYCAGDMDDNSWGGPVQGLIHQRSLPALLRYGHHAEIVKIAERWLGNLKACDRFVQQYNPFTGEPAPGDEGYGPTVLATLEYITHMYGVTVGEEKALWSALPETFEYVQEMYGTTFALTCDGQEAIATIGGEEAFRFTPGVRVQSDLSGHNLRVFGLVEGEVTVAGVTFSIRPNEEWAIETGKATLIRQIAYTEA